MNTYGDIGNATAGWYFRTLLSYAAAIVVLERFAAVFRLPSNETKVAQWRRPVPFSPALTPLAEGQAPGPTQMRYETISVQMREYGAYVYYTNIIRDFSKNRFVQDTAELQGDQVAATFEALRWAVVANGTSVHYGGTKTSRATIDKTAPYAVKIQDAMTTRLMRNKARKMNRILAASPDFGTYGIEASYMAFVHTDTLPMLRTLRRFTSSSDESDRFLVTARYGNRVPASEHEAGSFDDVRYIGSADLTPKRGAGATIQNADKTGWYYTGTKYDVYQVVLMGQEYFGTVIHRGPGRRETGRGGWAPSVSPRVVQPRAAAGDPLGQRGSIGWIGYHADKVLNDAWGDRAEFALSR